MQRDKTHRTCEKETHLNTLVIKIQNERRENQRFGRSHNPYRFNIERDPTPQLMRELADHLSRQDTPIKLPRDEFGQYLLPNNEEQISQIYRILNDKIQSPKRALYNKDDLFEEPRVKNPGFSSRTSFGKAGPGKPGPFHRKFSTYDDSDSDSDYGESIRLTPSPPKASFVPAKRMSAFSRHNEDSDTSSDEELSDCSDDDNDDSWEKEFLGNGPIARSKIARLEILNPNGVDYKKFIDIQMACFKATKELYRDPHSVRMELVSNNSHHINAGIEARKPPEERKSWDTTASVYCRLSANTNYGGIDDYEISNHYIPVENVSQFSEALRNFESPTEPRTKEANRPQILHDIIEVSDYGLSPPDYYLVSETGLHGSPRLREIKFKQPDKQYIANLFNICDAKFYEANLPPDQTQLLHQLELALKSLSVQKPHKMGLRKISELIKKSRKGKELQLLARSENLNSITSLE